MVAEACDPDATEAMELIYIAGFELKLWEDKMEQTWQVANWTEEDEVQMNGAVDADLDWISIPNFEQPDYM